MIKFIKKTLYFPLAYYFRFWAQIRLNFWRPTIVAITGSSGKTTLLHFVESQIGNKARYSHRANSSYGIPFDILGLERKNLTPDEWIFLFFLAPFKAFKKSPKEKLYIVEADCDRPGEGKFLASLLRPDYLLWISSSLTHSANFDYLVKNSSFPSVESAIAHEFGYFLEYIQKLVIVNGDSALIKKELGRSKVPIQKVNKKDLNNYKLYNDRTEFVIDNKKYSINFIVPKSVFYSISMTIAIVNNLTKVNLTKVDPWFSKFNIPPGRSSVFKGISNIAIIDSTYNATPDGVKAILEMFNQYPLENKWIVMGDMIELGEEEQKEHEKLADLINDMKLAKIILIGPRVSKYTYPKLKQTALQFLMPKDGLEYILQNIKGKETILFKGARFLEGIIEHLLLDKNDAKLLVRREKAWQNRRKAFGL